MSLVVAPWGDPGQWRPVEYCLEDRCEEAVGSSVALFRLLGAGRLLVIASYTLRANAGDVEGYVRGRGRLPEGAVVEVAPGFGSFSDRQGARWRFRGTPGHYFAFVYYAVLRSLEGVREVHLDLTHGINYMPFLAAEAVKAAAYAHAARRGDVEVSIYNSDPYVAPRDGGAERLRLHLVEGYTAARAQALRALGELALPHAREREDRRLAAAAVHGLLLYVASVGEVVRRRRGELEGLLEAAYRYGVREEVAADAQGRPAHEVAYLPEADRGDALLHALYTALEAVVEEAGRWTAGGGGRVELSLEGLGRLKGLFVADRALKALMESEKRRLTRRLREARPPTGPTPLACLRGERLDCPKDCTPKGREDAEERARNLLAHAGLEDLCTYVVKRGDGLYVGYLDPGAVGLLVDRLTGAA